jgi:hypothetical protein
VHISRPLLLTLFTLLLSQISSAEDRYFVFGGGPSPDSSQFSIEKNAIWIDEVLRQRAFDHSDVLFGAGTQGAADVVLYAPDDASILHWLPLARLYGKQEQARTQYRANHVTRSSGDFGKERVTALLDKNIQSLQSGDSLLLIYSGHGSFEPPDVSRNALRLWGETPLSVNDMTQLLDKTPQGATVRYVLPQCFSGAFTRGIVRNPGKPSLDEVATNRCGFVAVDEHNVAEGCTAGIDAGDYRDYATYFVAALAGQTRLGEALTRQPDLDGDGKVSLSEAHDYAYTEGFSTDVPRSTSDYYLELWEPWYVRWHTFVPLSDANPYWKAAQRLRDKLGIDASTPATIAQSALAKRNELERTITDRQAAHDNAYTQTEKLRKDLLKQFLIAWPNAMYPQSAAYAHFMQQQADAALQWIASQPDYARLAAMQDAAHKDTLDILELQRQQAQYARILRALHLATIRENFSRLASEKEQNQYNALTACESWTPPAQSSPGTAPQ